VKSVVVCGSKKYAAEIEKFCEELEKLGVMVFAPNFKEPLPENTKFASQNITDIVFKGLTLEHFDWIRKSEVCFVFNQNDYVGVSVTMEMAYASALGKPVFALSDKTGDPCRDSLIDKVVRTPKKFASLL
jgi:nucleoside 2-deoxyribosyltransferase